MFLVAASVPLVAEVDLAGSWASATIGDDVLLLGDYTGIPYNDAGRAKALAYSQSQMSEPEKVCLFYPQTQLFAGPFGLGITRQTGPDGKVIGWTLAGWEDRAPMMIWMNGRQSPSLLAPHERAGFTTGHWEGDVLVSHTTHMKIGFIRRNGASHSDQAALTIHFLRHGDLLTLAAALDDPNYLSEPLYWTRSFRKTRNQVELLDGPCVQGDEGVAEGAVPHFLPGQNPFMDEMNKSFHIPVIASQGGAETMYPEFRKKIKEGFTIIEKCTRCAGGRGPVQGAGPP
jgi:hypothetical protein